MLIFKIQYWNIFEIIIIIFRTNFFSKMENCYYNYYWLNGIPYYPIFWNSLHFQENQAVESQKSEMISIEPKQEEDCIKQKQESVYQEELKQVVYKPPKKEKALKKKKKNTDSLFSSSKHRKVAKNKIYERDDDRNILPNIVNKLFSFLGSKTKSMEKIKEFLKHNSEMYELSLVGEYFAYLKQLRISLNKFLMGEDIRNLFIVHKKLLYLFDEQTQIKLVSISIYLLRQYYCRNEHITSLFNSKRVTKTKISDYLRYYRQIQKQIQQLSSNFRRNYAKNDIQ